MEKALVWLWRRTSRTRLAALPKDGRWNLHKNSRVLGLRVIKLDSAVGPEVTRAVFEMRADEVVLLENLSIFKEDAANDVAFARQLGMLCEVFVNDAFDTADKPLASNTGITRWVPIAVAGPWFHERVQYLKQFLGNPTRPFMAIVGGSRIAQKLELLHAILPNLDRLFLGGSLAFSFLKVRGHETGKAPIEAGFRTFIEEFVERARKRVQLVLPEDFLIRDGNTVHCVRSIHSDDEPVDIGVHSLAQLTNLMTGAYSILWIDSLGVGAGRPSSSDWEVMQQIYASIPRRWQHAVLAGNELVASVSKSADASPFAHLTLFGDAAIDIIAGRKLAAVEALHVGGLRRNDRSRKRVLVPVDGSAHAREAAGLAARHVDVENAEIHLLYVHASESGTAELRSDPNELARMNAEAKMASLPVFEQITAELGRYGLAPHHQVIRQGDPGEQILEYANDIHAELIVMGSHGRSKGLRLLLGSASQRVVDNAPCPVLIARIQSARNR